MSDHNSWKRVTKRNPCPICERGDWCLVAADGTAAICARVESAKRCGDAGWLHRLVDRPQQPTRGIVRSVSLKSGRPGLDLGALATRWHAAVIPDWLEHFSRSQGLSAESLTALRIGWASAAELRRANTSCRGAGCWSFPMVDAAGAVRGVRLRTPDGFKYAVAGSREGLALPDYGNVDDRLLICEGPTDTAALLDMGFCNVAGRPSCTGGLTLLVELVRLRRPREVVIVADADEPGRRGAGNLASVLVAYAPIRVIEPPAGLKDARAWLWAGGTRRDVEQAIAAATVRRLTVRSREVLRDG